MIIFYGHFCSNTVNATLMCENLLLLVVIAYSNSLSEDILSFA